MSDLESRRHSVGIVAVQLGLITQKQLMDCVRKQSGDSADKTIDQILIAEGCLQQEQVEKILKEISRAQSPPPEPPPQAIPGAPVEGRPTRATSVKKRETVSQPKPIEDSPTVPQTVPEIPTERPTRMTSVRKRETTSRRTADEENKPTVSAVVPPVPALPEIPNPTPPGRATGVRHRGTTSKHLNPPKDRATAMLRRDDKPAPPPPKSKVGILIAILIPIVGVAIFLAIQRNQQNQPQAPTTNPSPVAARPSNTSAPVAVPSATAKPVVKDKRLRVTLTFLTGNHPIVARWNDVARQLNSTREPEQYKAYIDDLNRLVTDSKGTEYNDAITLGYRDVIDCIQKRAEQVFDFLLDDVTRLRAAGKFGDALASWDWFPRHLDLAGLYVTRIEAKKQETRDAAKTAYEKMRNDAQAFSDSGKLPEAKLLLLKALEIGIVEHVDDAYKRLTRLTELEDAQFRKAEEAQLAEFEKAKKSERESAKLIAVYRSQFWDLAMRRNLVAVNEFIAKERKAATGDIATELDNLKKTVTAMKAAFELVGEGLQQKVGTTLTLAFIENGVARERIIKLQRIDKETLKYLVEGKEFTAELAMLDTKEILKVGDAIPESRTRSLVVGLGHMLSNEFQAAHVDLKNAGDGGAPLLSFVEGSSSFLERNAPAVRDSAKAYMEAKQWDRAAEAFTKLAGIPAERKDALKGRARAYYQMNNFVGTVLDVESLFDMNEFSEEVIDLLNQSYKRATLIAKAINIYESAVSRVKDNPTIVVNLVRLYMQIHEFEKAKETIKKAWGSTGEETTLDLMSKPPFPGQTFKAMFGRYNVLTDISQEYATEMARFMDSVYRNYTKVFPYKKNEALRFHVIIFGSESDFIRYSQTTARMFVPPGSRLGAYYSPGTKQLVGFKDPGIHSTMTHEGLHQYMDYFVDDCPIWFNEGYASYFEYSTADEVKFNPERHATALGLLVEKKLPSVKELFLMDRKTFQDQGHLHYGSSWAMIYWLTKSGQRSILDRYFEDLMAGKTKEQAFDDLFGPGKLNLEALDAKWRSAIFKEEYETP